MKTSLHIYEKDIEECIVTLPPSYIVAIIWTYGGHLTKRELCGQLVYNTIPMIRLY